MRHVIFRRGEGALRAAPLRGPRGGGSAPATSPACPARPRGVAGVMNLRGRVVTVVELAPCSACPAPRRQPRKWCCWTAAAATGPAGHRGGGHRAHGEADPGAGRSVRAVDTGVARLGALAVTVLDPEGVDAAVVALFHGGGTR